MLDIIITFFVSVLLSFSFILIFSALFRKWKVLDNPKKYNKKRDPVPYGM
jgi:UDP-N-acetylmuramyl pentapeptide phosphotransferase/UDP-N-acetylglucosamine-1-phosphate transferase